MLQSGPIRIASLSRFLSVQLSLAVCEFRTAGEEHCERGHGRGVCEPLMPDVVGPEVQQNDRSYIRELSGPTFDPLHKNFARWAVTRSTEYLKKSQDCQNWGWALAQDNTRPLGSNREDCSSN